MSEILQVFRIFSCQMETEFLKHLFSSSILMIYKMFMDSDSKDSGLWGHKITFIIMMILKPNILWTQHKYSLEFQFRAS